MSPFDHVVNGDVDYFQKVELDVLLKSRDSNDDTVFSKAVMENQLPCCREIYKRCPSLIWLENGCQNTPLHHSLWYRGSIQLVEFVINEAARAKNQDDETAFKKWLAHQNYEGDTALSYAVLRRNYEAVRLLMEFDHDLQILRIANHAKITPLHLVVEYQDLEMVKLLAIRPNSDLEFRANKDGDVPLVMAMRKALSPEYRDDNTSVEIVKRLLRMRASQINVRTGDRGWTWLHHATHTGNLRIVEDTIQAYPDCVEEVDNEGRNFLHLAAEFGHVQLVKQILETMHLPEDVLNLPDNYGNTPLHIAVENENRNMALCLLYEPRVKKTIENGKGVKAINAITFDYDKEKAGVYGVRDRVNEQELKEQSDFDLVVGALIATVSFTAGITVPGGYISDGPHKGMAVLSKTISFKAFVISNNLALVFSLYAVFSHFCTRRLLKREDIIKQVTMAMLCTLAAMFLMMIAFIMGSYAVLANSNDLAISVCVNCGCFFIFALRALWKMGMQHKHSIQNFFGFSNHLVRTAKGLTLEEQ